MAQRIVDSYNAGGSSEVVNENQIAVGQSFTGNGGKLSSVGFYLKKYNSPTGSAVAKIYAHTGTFGVSSKPTGTALAISDVLDTSTLSSSTTLTPLVFSGANKITLTAGTNYVVTFECSEASPNGVYIQEKYTPTTHPGNYSYLSGIWTPSADYDLDFHVYADPVVSAPPTYDTTTSGQTATNLGTTLTLSHICSSESNASGILVVGVGTRNGKSVTGITYGGDALTKIRHDQPGADSRTELWYKLLPKVGTNDVVVTISANDYIRAGAISYSNVSSVGDNDGTGVTTDTQATSSLTLTATRLDVVLDVINLQGNNDGLTSGQTDRWDQRIASEARSAGSSKTGETSTVMSWSWTGNKAFSHSAVVLQPPQTIGPFPTFLNP